jgi:hypothetical protein
MEMTGWKLWPTIKNTSHIWNSKQNFLKFYNPSENLAIHKVIVLFKVRAIFRQYISKNTKVLALKFTNLATQLVTYMTWKVYLRKDRHHMAQHLTATHAKVTELSRKIKDLATNCIWPMSFSSPEPVYVKCLKCDVALCVDKTCFADYPTNMLP